VATDQRQGPQDEQTAHDANPDRPFDAAKVRALYDQALRYQRKANQEYWMNSAFLEGHQWLWWDTHSRSIAELPRDEDRVQATMNRLAHSTRSIISKYTQRELGFEVLPDAGTDAAMTGAKIAEAVIEGVRKSHDWEVKREIVGRAAWKAGTAGICVDWDKNAGAPLFDGGLTADDPNQRAAVVYEGDSVETVLSIAEIALQPGVKDGETGTYWIKAVALPPEDVKGMFSLDKLPPADASAGLTPFASKLLASHSAEGNEERPDLTLVLTYYERPNPANKEGRVAIVVDNKFVDGPKAWPFPWTDRLNLVLHRETPSETSALGTTILSQARYSQVALNSAWSNYLEHLKNAGNARLMIDAASLDLIDALTDLPGEIIPVPTGIERPEWLQPAPIADALIRLLEELRMEIDDQLGIHDVSRGTAPVNIESGYGLSILAEQDNSPVGRMVKDSANLWSKVASMVLKLYEDNTEHQRTTTVKADKYGPKTVAWSGDSFAGQTDVSIPLDAIMPRSRAAQMAVAEKFVQMGLVQDIETAAMMAELPGQKDLIAAVNPDLNRARNENFKMSQGRPALVAPFDNDEVHIRAHESEMKNMEWDDAPEEIKAMFLEHVQQHLTMAAEKAGKAQARAQVSPVLATAPALSGTPTIPAEALPDGSLVDAGPQASLPMNAQEPTSMDAAVPPGAPAPLEGMGMDNSQLPPEAIAAAEQ
jgi:hypothetical protein